MHSEFKSEEKRTLEEVASWLDFGQGMHLNTIRWCATEILKLARGTSCLELGCADGNMTVILEKYFERMVAVDGSEEFIRRTRSRVSKKVEVIHSLFEDLDFHEQFDTIIISHVLEHVVDPIGLLRQLQTYLAPNGTILVVVPNALSLHRRAAVYMGLLSRPDELDMLDIRLGHRRVYSPETLKQDILKAGLKVERTGGIFLKVLSNAQLEATWSQEMLEAYYKLGAELPDLCAEIYAECVLN